MIFFFFFFFFFFVPSQKCRLPSRHAKSFDCNRFVVVVLLLFFSCVFFLGGGWGGEGVACTNTYRRRIHHSRQADSYTYSTFNSVAGLCYKKHSFGG